MFVWRRVATNSAGRTCHEGAYKHPRERLGRVASLWDIAAAETTRRNPPVREKFSESKQIEKKKIIEKIEYSSPLKCTIILGRRPRLGSADGVVVVVVGDPVAPKPIERVRDDADESSDDVQIIYARRSVPIPTRSRFKNALFIRRIVSYGFDAEKKKKINYLRHVSLKPYYFSIGAGRQPHLRIGIGATGKQTPVYIYIYIYVSKHYIMSTTRVRNDFRASSSGQYGQTCSRQNGIE